MSENIKCVKFDDDKNQLIERNYQSALCSGYLCCNGYMLPDIFSKCVSDILNMNVRDEDIWVCSFPKAGTTWTQEMVWCIKNHLNFELSSKVSLSQRFPFLDVLFILNLGLLAKENPIAAQHFRVDTKLEKINNMPSPRFIKTHLPFDFLPLQLQHNSTNAKIIFVTRNPRDACISQFYHTQVYHGFRNTFPVFAELFLEGLTPYGPYWNHLFSYWKNRSHKNMIINSFEEMKNDLSFVIKRSSQFIGEQLKDNEILELCHHLQFQNMKSMNSVNKKGMTDMMKKLNGIQTEAEFMRSGKINQWRERMNPDLILSFEKWEKYNLEGTDYKLQ